MHKYNDYVIKEGIFIGEFDEMYRNCDNPWHQTSNEYNNHSFSKMATILNIKKHKVKSIIQFGCGLGFYTNMIAQNANVKIIGIDKSLTAIKKAESRFPELTFVVDEVLNIDKYMDFDAILFTEITWYILNDLNKILDKMSKFWQDKLFLHNLVFYKGQQKYGQEYFASLKEFIDYIPFPLIGYSESTSIDSDVIETSTVFRIQRK